MIDERGETYKDDNTAVSQAVVVANWEELGDGNVGGQVVEGVFVLDVGAFGEWFWDCEGSGSSSEGEKVGEVLHDGWVVF